MKIQTNITDNLTKVLIETLWNVNRSEQVKRCGNAVCFNRNIVECKFGGGCVIIDWLEF